MPGCFFGLNVLAGFTACARVNEPNQTASNTFFQTFPQGPPFANAVVDAVNTLNPGDAATVSVSFDGVNVHFNFGIPQGQPGPAGTNGSDGGQGPVGEVRNAALAGAINGTSSNSNGVATLGLVVSDPPTQTEMQSLANKLDELLVALRR